MVDSLVLENLYHSDLPLLDTTLALYHKAVHDTTKLQYIDFIIENCNTSTLWPGYNSYMKQMAEQLIAANPTEEERNKYLYFKANAINNLGYGADERGDFYQAIEYYEESLKIQQQIDNKGGISMALGNLGTVYHSLDNYSKAMKLLTQSIAIKKEINDKEGVAKDLNNMGVIYSSLEDLSNALKYHLQSHEIKMELGNRKMIATSYHNLGGIYRDLGDLNKALEYMHKSLQIDEELENKRGIAVTLNNIASLYMTQNNVTIAMEYATKSLEMRRKLKDKFGVATSTKLLAKLYSRQGDHSRAIENLEEALVAFEEAGNKSWVSSTLSDIATMKSEMGEHEEALKYYQRACKVFEEINSIASLSGCLVSMATIHFLQNNYTKAEMLANRGLNLARESGYPDKIAYASKLLTQLYNKKGDWKKAFEMQTIHQTMKDSIKSEENLRALLKNQYKYKYEKEAVADSVAYVQSKKVQEAKLDKARIQLWAVIGGLLLLIGFSSLMYHRFRIAKRQKLIIENQKIEIESTLEQLVATQEHLIHTEKMASLGQVTAGIAHEINNPLNYICQSTSALERDLTDLQRIIAKYKEAFIEGKCTAEEVLAFEQEVDYEFIQKALTQEINTINEGTKMASTIVKSLWQFLQVDREEMRSEDIHMAIGSILKLLNTRMNGSIKVVKNYDESIGKINCHIGQLSQVFMNLLVNAIYAMEGEGEINITTNVVENDLMISIKDNGPGMPEGTRSKIFEPFFTTKESGKGTGLGLFISHGIIKNHSGTIEVKSELGKGTEFVIGIPK